MEEKKNANQPPEIKDEELDQVTGGLDEPRPVQPKDNDNLPVDEKPESTVFSRKKR